MANASSKPWVVQKYGGTSIGKLLKEITSLIIPEYLKTHNVAVVCSARSSLNKFKGTTSLLLEAIHHAASSETSTQQLDKIIDTIKSEHLEAAREIIVTGETPVTEDGVLESLILDIENDCERLRSFLRATWTVGEISDRTQDRVLSVGEKLSCRLVATTLQSLGVPTSVVLLDNVVQDAYSNSVREQRESWKRQPAHFLKGLSQAIGCRILECGNNVPIITGFFGAMPESLIDSVGRGYSDLCAALCAVSIGAEELQIWKEVDGVFTADPRKVHSARLLATVTAEEAAELTYYGSEVIHPLTIQHIGAANIPLRLKNVKAPSGSGTIIYPPTKSPSSSPGLTPATATDEESAAKLHFMNTNGYDGENQQRRYPTAVTTKEGITVVNIQSNGKCKPKGFLGLIGEKLNLHDLTIDLISSSQQSVSLAVSLDGAEESGRRIEDLVPDLEGLGTVTISQEMSIVSVVGHKMKNMVGVAGEVFSALASARINIYLISQGANEINISFIVQTQDAISAMEVVHTNVMRVPLHAEKENHFIKGPWLY